MTATSGFAYAAKYHISFNTASRRESRASKNSSDRHADGSPLTLAVEYFSLHRKFAAERVENLFRGPLPLFLRLSPDNEIGSAPTRCWLKITATRGILLSSASMDRRSVGQSVWVAGSIVLSIRGPHCRPVLRVCCICLSTFQSVAPPREGSSHLSDRFRCCSRMVAAYLSNMP